MRRLNAPSLHLRAVEPPDVPQLYRMAVAPEAITRWRLRGTSPSPDQFERLLWDSILAQFVVTDERNEALALVSAYNAHSDGYAYLSVLSRSDAPGVGLHGTALLLVYLFDTFPLRIVYGESPDLAYRQFASGQGRYFDVEGRMRERRPYRDGYVDEVILAIHRHHLPSIRTFVERAEARASRRLTDQLGSS